MKIREIYFFIVFCVCVNFTFAQTPTPEDDEVIKVETNLVSFPVSVLGKDGKFIPNLKKENFQIFENGVQQDIEYFSSVDKPFTVIFIIDRSDSIKPILDDVKKAAIASLNNFVLMTERLALLLTENLTY